ncbi:formyltransferase family protein [Castellaniella sp. GW247-6E4]|uniref:methionyl-tRNA formyltransferase n=1 Tax=Castellaniella sp. GW247-6E4 TaxID=3140380 RepID=UPI003314AF44
MKIAIIGRTEILYETARFLHDRGFDIACVITSKEAPEYTRTASDFIRLAENLDVPFAKGSNIVDHMQLLRDSTPDIGISMNYTGIVPQDVIDIFPHGILNAHGGDLPRYRGNACQAWAILAGESRIGLCVHRMIGGELDSGDIVARDYLPINISTKVTDIWRWMAKETPALMYSALQEIIKNPEFILERQSLDPQDALRCYPRRPEDGKIDWHQAAVDIIRLINASNKPYAGGFCDFNGHKMTIWEACLPSEGERFLAVPGQVTAVDECYIDVACGSGKIRVLKAEMNGHSAYPSTWVKSIRDRLK